MEADGRRGGCPPVTVAGDGMGVGVGLDDPGDLEPFLARQPEVVVPPVTPGVHHDRLARLAAADQVRQTTRFLVLQLVEDHRGVLRVYYRGIPGREEGTPWDRYG